MCCLSFQKNDKSKLIRCTLQAGLVCQTIANRPVESGTESSLTRNDISCKMIYAINGKPVILSIMFYIFISF